MFIKIIQHIDLIEINEKNDEIFELNIISNLLISPNNFAIGHRRYQNNAATRNKRPLSQSS